MTVSKPSSPLPTKIVLAVLFCAMITLFCAMIFTHGNARSPQGATPLDPALLTLPRKAQERVNFLHGEGDDFAVECFLVGNVHYVVGTTSSHAYDFTSSLAGANLFVALVEDDTLTRVKIFGDDGQDSCVAACLAPDGMLVLGQSDKHPNCVLLYRIRYYDLAVERQLLRTDEPVYPVALYSDGEKSVCVASATDNSRLHVFALNGSTSTTDTLAVERGTLAFCAIFPSQDGYDLLATAVVDGSPRPVLFSQAQEWRCSFFEGVEQAVLVDVMPRLGGYALLVQGGGQSQLLWTRPHSQAVSLLADLPYLGRAELAPNGEQGCFVAFFEHGTYALVDGAVTTVALPACDLLACTVGADGAPLFALAYGEGLGLYSTHGKVTDLALLASLPDTARSLIEGALPPALFANSGALLFSTALPDSGHEIGLVFFAQP